MANKRSILFIASNIPTPKRKSNDVVIQIGNRLSRFYDVRVLFPNERTPFPVSLMKKYRHLHGIKPWFSGDLQVIPLKYIRIPGAKGSFRLLPLCQGKLERFVRQNGKPDLAHAHYVLPDGYLAFLLKRLYGIPYCVTVRASDVKSIQKMDKGGRVYRMMLDVMANADMICALNQGVADVVAMLGFRSLLLPHGIDLSSVNLSANRVDDGVVRVVSVSAKLAEKGANKNMDWVVRAFKSYKGKHKIQLSLIGGGTEEELAQLREMVAQDSRIAFLGKLPHDEVMQSMCRYDVFALPSDHETFGLVFLEAAASGNAVIARKGTGVWGVFAENEEMMFPDSYDEFEKMLHLLVDDADLRNRMAKRGQAKVVNELSWETIMKKYCELYDRLLP